MVKSNIPTSRVPKLNGNTMSSRTANMISNKIVRYKPLSIYAPTSPTRSEVDSIISALRSYNSFTVNEVIIVPYYIGLEVDVYLSHDINETLVIANGDKVVHHSDIGVFRNMFKSLHNSIDWTTNKRVLVEGVISPGAFMGLKPVCHKDYYDHIEPEDGLPYLCLEDVHGHYHVQHSMSVEVSDEYSYYLRDIMTGDDTFMLDKYGEFNCSQFKYFSRTRLPFLRFIEPDVSPSLFQTDWSTCGKTTEVDHPDCAPKFFPTRLAWQVSYNGSTRLPIDNLDSIKKLEKSHIKIEGLCTPTWSFSGVYADTDAITTYMKSVSESAYCMGVRIMPRYAPTNMQVPYEYVVRDPYLISMMYGLGYKEDLQFIIQKEKEGEEQARLIAAKSQQLSKNMLNDLAMCGEDSPNPNVCESYTNSYTYLQARLHKTTNKNILN